MNSEQVSFESFAGAGERLCGPHAGRELLNASFALLVGCQLLSIGSVPVLNMTCLMTCQVESHLLIPFCIFCIRQSHSGLFVAHCVYSPHIPMREKGGGGAGG